MPQTGRGLKAAAGHGRRLSPRYRYLSGRRGRWGLARVAAERVAPPGPKPIPGVRSSFAINQRASRLERG